MGHRALRAVRVVVVLTLAASAGWASERNALVRFSWDGPQDLRSLQEEGRVRWVEPGIAIVEVSSGRLSEVVAKHSDHQILDREVGEDCYWLVSGLAEENRRSVARLGHLLYVSPAGTGILKRCRPDPIPPVDRCRLVRLPRVMRPEGWLPSAGSGPLEPYLAELRTAGSRRLETARRTAAEIDSAAIRSHLRALSTYADGSLRTRYYLRDETSSEALPYIEAALTSSLSQPEDTVWRQPFQVTYRVDEAYHQKEVYNVVGVHRGAVGGGAYIVCAHYDAIGIRTPGWDWERDPAPGADDNGTGVACLLECARVLGSLSFDFDLLFIAFTAEEPGLLGSKHYADSAAAHGDSILGLLNIDMVGYDPDGSRVTTVLANDRSEWIAEWLIETADSLELELNATEVPMASHMVLRSDHGYFVTHGFPAVSCWENVEGDSSEFNPYYHTVEDTLGHISIPLTTTVAAMVAGAVALLAEPESETDFAVPPNGVVVRPRRIAVGDTVTIQAVVRNLGPGTDGPADFAATLFEGPLGGPLRTVLTREISLDLPIGTWKYAELEWVPGAGSVGEREVAVQVVPGAPLIDANPENNRGSRGILVQATEEMAPRLFDVYAYPNPARDLAELTFHYQLSRGTGVAITVYTLEGQEIGFFRRSYEPSVEEEGTQAGSNRVLWGWFEQRPASLSPGLYFYSIEIETGASEATAMGKFAVIR